MRTNRNPETHFVQIAPVGLRARGDSQDISGGCLALETVKFVPTWVERGGAALCLSGVVLLAV